MKLILLHRQDVKGAVIVQPIWRGRGTDILLGGNAEYLAKADLEDHGIDESTPNYETF